MLYYSCLKITDFDQTQTEVLLSKIRAHFSHNVNLKKKESVISKALLCYIVEEKFGITDFYIDCDENGKPFFVDPALYFNISHSGEYVICLCGDERVGCDTQSVKPYKERVVKRFFTSEEYNILSESLNKELDFTRLWTMKESILKYYGDGISGGLSTYDFSNFLTEDKFTAYGLCFKMFHLSGYSVCVCSRSGEIFEFYTNADNILKLRKGD